MRGELDYLLDRMELLLSNTAIEAPEKIDALFEIDHRGNTDFMKKADPARISAGTGSGTPAIQKAETVIEVLRDTKDPVVQLQKETDIMMAIAPKWMRETDLNRLIKLIESTPADKIRKMNQLVPQDLSRILSPEELIELCMGDRTRKADGIFALEGTIEKKMNIKCGLWADPVMSRVIKKARKKLNAYVSEITAASTKSQSPEDLIAEGLHRFFMNPGESAQGERRGLFGIMSHEMIAHTPMWKFLTYAGMLRWRIMFPVAEKDREYIKNTAEKAVERVLKSCILSQLAAEYMADSGPTGEPERCLEEEDDLSFMFSRVSRFNYGEILMMCFYATAVEIEKKTALEKDAELYEYRWSSEQDRDTAATVQDLRSENRKLKETVKDLSRRLKEAENNAAGAEKDRKKIETLEAKVNELNKTILSYERKVSSIKKEKDREIRLLKGQLEKTEQQEKRREQTEKKEEPKNAVTDMDGKYLFICQYEPLCRKIEQAFKNSKVSTKYRPDPTSIKSFDACVCISKDVSHPSYWKFKDMCILAGIPFLHCNTTSIKTISRFLGDNGYVKVIEEEENGD